MVWTDLSSAFTYNSQLTSAQQRALRDNITAMANGDDGAPRVRPEALSRYPKCVSSYIQGGMQMPEAAGDNYTLPCLMYKTPADQLLHCKILAIPASYLGYYPAGYVQVTVVAIKDGLHREAAVTPVLAPQTNGAAAWYSLNPLDLSDFPDHAFFEARLKYNWNTPGYNANWRYLLNLQSLTFYLEPQPESGTGA